MSNKNTSSSSGVGFFGLMFLVFMTLKLIGYITWSWWWVTAPLWGGAILWIFAILIIMGVLLILEKFFR
jgi:hypothetical protein